MSQLQNIEAIEKRLWGAADLLRANSGLASNEYFMPVMGVILMRHAYSRYLAVKPAIEAGLPSRGGKTRALTKEDFGQQGAIYLRPEAQFDHLVSLPDSTDRAAVIIAAMDGIEADYDALRGVLPKAEYHKIANQDLGELLRKPDLDKAGIEKLKKVSQGLLATLKARLADIADWQATEGNRDAVRVTIHDFLYADATGLPADSYDEQDVEAKTDAVYQHVWRAYQVLPSPVFSS